MPRSLRVSLFFQTAMRVLRLRKLPPDCSGGSYSSMVRKRKAVTDFYFLLSSLKNLPRLRHQAGKTKLCKQSVQLVKDVLPECA